MPHRASAASGPVRSSRSWRLEPLDADRAFSEIATRDLHVHAARLLAGEGAVERGAELLRRLHPNAETAASFDDLLVMRVIEGRRDRAFFAVELDLTATNLRPPGVVADDGDDRNVLAGHGLELH